MKKTAILGFGNPARSDDGIGCYVAGALKDRFGDVDDLKILDMGTSAFEVLFELREQERILLVDAVIHSGEPDGTLFHLPASEIDAAVQHDPMVFLHGLKWDQALSYAKKILGDDYPEDIGVYLVAVTDTRLEIGLSEPVRRAGDRLCQLIAERLGVPSPREVPFTA